MTAQDSIAIVERYLAHLAPTKARLIASFDAFFTDETIWENVGLCITKGIQEAKALVDSFPISFEYMSVDILHIAKAGDAVLTERLDHFHDADGHIVATLRVAGIFEIADGRIVRWRDYFDTAGLLSASGSGGQE